MKARGVDSPDDADALFLTFAAPVAAVVKKPVKRRPSEGRSWMA